MNLRPYFYVIIPVLLWSMQTTSTSWFIRYEYSPMEVALYRSTGAILFALVVAGSSAYRGFHFKQFVPGTCLALNFLFFTLALNIAFLNKYRLFGPVLMTVEASNFIFCLPILWVLRKPAQMNVAALILYILGMLVLVLGALQKDSGSYGKELLLFALLTSFTFALFNCTLDFAGKGNNRSVSLMLPIFVLNMALVLIGSHAHESPLFGPSMNSVGGWFVRIWNWKALGLLLGVGFVQTGGAYFFWSKAAQRFSPLTLSLSFLWTVPIAYIVTVLANPLLFAKTIGPMQNVHDLRTNDALAVCFLIGAFYCDNKNVFPSLGKIVLEGRSIKQVRASLRKEVQEFGNIKVPKLVVIRNSVCVRVDGREMTSYATSDYLGLAGESELRTVAVKAIQDSGWGLSSARPVVGTQNIHNQAEKVLSEYLGTDESLLFPSAYAANLAAFEWTRPGSVILYDELCHGSLKDGIKLSNAGALDFRHLDMEHLEDRLNRRDVLDSESVVIVTDGVFSTTGEVANLGGITALAEHYNCLVAVDDTHGTGLLGTKGTGTHELRNCVGKIDILITSLTKALGCPYGGVFAGRSEIVQHVRAFGHSYRFSNAVSPVVAAMAMKAIELLRGDLDRRTRLFANLSAMKSRLAEVEKIEHPTFAIRFSNTLDNRSAAEFVYSNLLERNILPALLEPPYTIDGDYCVRFQLSALHAEKQIVDLAEALSVTIGLLRNSSFLRSGQGSTAPVGSGLCF